jgi:hypothetical protein
MAWNTELFCTKERAMIHEDRELISFNRVMRCQRCGGYGKCPHTFTVASIPFALQCVSCSHTELFDDESRKFPKFPPQNGLHYFRVISVTKEKDENGETVVSSTINAPGNYYEKAKKLGELTVEMYAKLSEMETDLNAFRESIADAFMNAFDKSSVFQYWNSMGLTEFIRNPYIAIPVRCEDSLAASYSRWIIAPKFFEEKIGVPVEASGGFRLYIINQYTRMSKHLDAFQCKLFGDIPESLDLKVYGRKLIGSSLPMCWRDIPGLREDSDSTSECVSVYMDNPCLSRQWLARHGVNPWEDKPVKDEDMLTIKLDELIAKNPQFKEAWDLFIAHGRVGVFWNDALEARRFCYLAAFMLKGVVPVFVESNAYKMLWSGLYAEVGTKNTSSSVRNKLIFTRNGEAVVWEHVLSCQTIIVDAYGELDSDIVDKLFYFKGRIIIIGNDYILDANNRNVIAPIIHGLSVYNVTDKIGVSPDQVRGRYLDKWIPELADSLMKMKGT